MTLCYCAVCCIFSVYSVKVTISFFVFSGFVS